MKKNNHFLKHMCAFFVILATISCKCRVEDLGLIEQFHKSSTKSIKERPLGNEVDLYVDYSDCMTTATASSYYNIVQPAIIACNPNYYSIKGNEITKETNDKMKIYRLLNTITNVDYSNIKGAVANIINNRNEAILITDGEYYQKGIGPNLTNPYLADEFKKWLTMGYDIYVYCEPYTSQGYTKNRFYMLFTDHKKENNIQEIFARNIPKHDDVKMVHLYSGTPTIKFANNKIQFNEQLIVEEVESNPLLSYDSYDMYAAWEDAVDYVFYATDDNGDPIEGGDFVFKGIDINIMNEDAYKPAELELKCYEISDIYTNMDSVPNHIALPAPMSNMFVVDNEAWNKGLVVAKFHPDFNGLSLNGTVGNLIRIDLCVKKSKENFIETEIGKNFKFDSPWGYNTSIYESLKQVLVDPSISPENSGNAIIHTIYLSCYTK